MAGELQVDYVAGRNVYFLLRDSTGQIWNGSAFAAYVTANYATYPISGMQQGTASGFYAGDMPSATAGCYSVVAKERAGGSPAEADVSIGWGQVDWDGSAVSSLSSVALSNAGIDAVLDRTDGVEANRTLREGMRLMLSALVGILSGAAGTTIKIRDTNDTKDRITATVDSSGNRTAVTLDDT